MIKIMFSLIMKKIIFAQSHFKELINLYKKFEF